MASNMVNTFFSISIVIGLIVLAVFLIPVLEDMFTGKTDLIIGEYLPENVPVGEGLEEFKYVDSSIKSYDSYDVKLEKLFSNFDQDDYFYSELDENSDTRFYNIFLFDLKGSSVSSASVRQKIKEGFDQWISANGYSYPFDGKYEFSGGYTFDYPYVFYLKGYSCNSDPDIYCWNNNIISLTSTGPYSAGGIGRETLESNCPDGVVSGIISIRIAYLLENNKIYPYIMVCD